MVILNTYVPLTFFYILKHIFVNILLPPLLLY